MIYANFLCHMGKAVSENPAARRLIILITAMIRRFFNRKITLQHKYKLIKPRFCLWDNNVLLLKGGIVFPLMCKLIIS
jgi:hypothetical protein